MKITQLRDKDKTTALTTMDMETWIGKTRTETQKKYAVIISYRLMKQYCRKFLWPTSAKHTVLQRFIQNFA